MTAPVLETVVPKVTAQQQKVQVQAQAKVRGCGHCGRAKTPLDLFG